MKRLLLSVVLVCSLAGCHASKPVFQVCDSVIGFDEKTSELVLVNRRIKNGQCVKYWYRVKMRLVKSKVVGPEEDFIVQRWNKFELE